jgi:hypothetical protein
MDLHWSLLNTSHTRVLVDEQEDAKAMLVRNDCGWTLYLIVNGRAEITKHQCIADYRPLFQIGIQMAIDKEKERRDALLLRSSLHIN